MSETTGPTSAHKELITSAEFEQAVTRLSGFDLDAWFTDSERRAKLVEWLHTEASCPKIVAQLGVKVLAPLVCNSVKATGKWVAQSFAGKIVNQFLAHPNVDKFIDAIEQFAAKMDGQLAAKRAFEAKVLNLSPSTADFRFQLQPELLGQMAQIDALAGIKDDLQKLINKQPKLELPFAGDEEKNRFIYSRRYVPFVGRDNELELLDQFLGSEKGFAWSLVSGPGGMGKSRLALEFVIKKAGAFAAGFLSRENLHKIGWSDWQPIRPTLMVIDYASLDADAVGNITAALSRRNAENSLDFPVRLLLLERTTDGPWLGTVKCTASGTNKAAVRDTFVRLDGRAEEGAGDLALQPIAPETLWQFMQAIIEKRRGTAPGQAETLQMLSDIDPQMRPLYAAFLADAIGRNKDARKWDRRQLLDDVLSYERKKYWQPYNVTEQHENLLALATVRGGLSHDEIKKACKNDEDGYLPEWNATDINNIIKAIHGSSDTGFLSAFEPDILGEVFVLERLNANRQFTAKLAEWAWNSSPFPYAGFVDRLAQDFPASFVPGLVGTIFSINDGQQAHLAVMLSINLINVLGKTDEHRQTAIELYGELKALAKKQNTSEIWLAQAQAAVNLINALGKTDEHRQTAIELYGELKALAKAQDASEIWLAPAQAAFNLISALVKTDEHRQTAIELYGEFKVLAKAQDISEIWLRQAQAAAKLITAIGDTAEHHQTAIELYGELKALAKAQDIAGIWLAQAQAAFNLIIFLGKTDEHRQMAVELYGEFKALAKVQDTAEIWLRQAQAAVNLISDLGEADEHSQMAIELYGELKALAKAQDTAEIWQKMSEGGGVMILGALLRFVPAEADYFAMSLEAFLKSDQEKAAERFVLTAALYLRACELENGESFEQAKTMIMELGDIYDAVLPHLEQFRTMGLGVKPQD